MTAVYDVVLKDGLEETRLERAFPAELHPGKRIHIDGGDWVVVQIRERAGLTPELIAVPAEFLS